MKFKDADRPTIINATQQLAVRAIAEATAVDVLQDARIAQTFASISQGFVITSSWAKRQSKRQPRFALTVAHTQEKRKR